jgi:hypothetical protein
MAKKKEKAEETPVVEAKPVAPPVAQKPKKVKNAGRLAPKNKKRVPRKVKKALAKAEKAAFSK